MSGVGSVGMGIISGKVSFKLREEKVKVKIR